MGRLTNTTCIATLGYKYHGLHMHFNIQIMLHDSRKLEITPNSALVFGTQTPGHSILNIYETLPLGPTQQETRIVKLLPRSGSGSDIPKYELLKASFGDQPDYEALSYTWEQGSGNSEISL
ncbi:uncharacterized protein BDR25DRAFT_358616 [Lindgomyces ingoldianus]|uniref:Uncharacterized protein n=1 Tax=Lindgomyces ingoldianus TaxID=673940 RepID=A0ACB6QKK6_9PLEO|nr:uncharacterized protein BDR25DRAFT_358616 [Lindgomyces ingoldianus]KAF2467499.1 hypothetical protein BDR25DRAFT_358616 [Lindgomyces ingoldianus]